MTNAGWYNEGNRGSTLENLAVAADEDGRLEVFTYENAGYNQILHKWQVRQNANWTDWVPLPVVQDQRYQSMFLEGHTNLFVALLQNGALWLVTESLWSIKQTAANQGWSGWGHVDGFPDTFIPSAVLRSMNGKLAVFGVDQDSFDILFTSEVAPNGGWAPVGNFGNMNPDWGSWVVRADDWPYRSLPARSGRPTTAVGANEDGRLQFFAVSPQAVFGRYQTALNGDSPWSDWLDLGAPPNLENNGDECVIQNEDGHLEVFAVGSPGAGALDYRWCHLWQNGPNGGWTLKNWTLLAGSQEVAFWPHRSTLRAARNTSGSIQLFAIGPQGDVLYTSQTEPNRGWTGNWTSLGGEAITAMEVGQNEDGRLEVFIISNGSLWHRWQTRAGLDHWSSDERK